MSEERGRTSLGWWVGGQGKGSTVHTQAQRRRRARQVSVLVRLPTTTARRSSPSIQHSLSLCNHPSLHFTLTLLSYPLTLYSSLHGPSSLHPPRDHCSRSSRRLTRRTAQHRPRRPNTHIRLQLTALNLARSLDTHICINQDTPAYPPAHRGAPPLPRRSRPPSWSPRSSAPSSLWSAPLYVPTVLHLSPNVADSRKTCPTRVDSASRTRSAPCRSGV